MKNHAGKPSVIKAFEGARGLAALFVAWYHTQIGADHLAVVRGAYLFVDFFFVLSGFVIAGAYTDRLATPQQVKSFFIRRFGRLFPLLAFSTLCFLLAANALVLAKHAALALGHGGALARPGELSFVVSGLPEALATLTMTQGLGFFDRLALNPVSWSISTEFYTYLVFALLCFLLQGDRKSVV
jgi:peptidoglycan/LPS O-acetylase OafA/YrhL